MSRHTTAALYDEYTLSSEVDRAARSVAAEWSEVVEVEDLSQGIWAHLLENHYVETVESMDIAARRSVLRRIAGHVASDAREDYDYFTGNFNYSTQEVRKILKAGSLTEHREFETNTERLDLDEGMDLLGAQDNDYAKVVFLHYAVGESQDVSNGQRLTRAVDALTRCMNSVHKNRHAVYTEGPGTRKVISNAQARAISDSYYDGDEVNLDFYR